MIAVSRLSFRASDQVVCVRAPPVIPKVTVRSIHRLAWEMDEILPGGVPLIVTIDAAHRDALVGAAPFECELVFGGLDEIGSEIANCLSIIRGPIGNQNLALLLCLDAAIFAD
jgi:hypothetical protein